MMKKSKSIVDSTTIRMKWDTYHKLKAKKRGGETFDDMIKRRFRL